MTSPVTQVAEVAVKTAVSGFVKLPSAEENGIISKTAPTAIIAAKLRTIVAAGSRDLLLGFITGILKTTSVSEEAYAS